MSDVTLSGIAIKELKKEAISLPQAMYYTEENYPIIENSVIERMISSKPQSLILKFWKLMDKSYEDLLS